MDKRRFNYFLSHIKFDEAAFRSLYRYYYPKIVLHIKFLYPGADAESVGQEFFLSLMTMKSIKYIYYPTSWVYTVCENIVKKQNAKKIDELSFNEKIADTDALVSALDIEDRIFEVQFTREILDSVDERTRKILILRYWQGYAFKEIADILNLSAASVRQIHHRALKIIEKNHSSVTKEAEKGLLLSEDSK